MYIHTHTFFISLTQTVNQAKLREEEERRQANLARKKETEGHINIFSLGSLSQQYSTTPLDAPSKDINSSTQSTIDENKEEAWSLTGWIGSWIGWK